MFNNYEIHVTVEKCEIDHFKRYCYDVNMKPILIELQRHGNFIGEQLMCGTKICGELADVIKSSLNAQRSFSEKGLNVQRVKIETDITNPINFYTGLYYETHIPLLIESESILDNITRMGQWHVSKNAFKETEDGRKVFFITFRTKKLSELNGNFEKMLTYLREKNIMIKDEKIERECVIVDTNFKMDSDWTGIM